MGLESAGARGQQRAAEFKDCCMRLGSPHKLSNRFRNIFYIDRLQPGQAAVERRVDWKLAKEFKDGGKKRVIRSEHHRCIIECCPDRQFAFSAFSNVLGC
jgi:hypothetical protein